MTKNIYIIVGVILIVAVLAFLNSSTKTEAPVSQSETDQSTVSDEELSPFGLSIPLLSEGDLGVIGGVDIFELEGEIEVVLSLQDTSGSVSSPAHLHSGSCDTLGAIVYPLNPVLDGSSQTTLNVSVDEFRAELPLVANVHKSEEEMAISMACGSVSEE